MKRSKRIAETDEVRILLAVESGSRAWGFASADSDWDVRFVYIHRPEWYLSIQPRRDVIERQSPGNLDVSGWDLRKALLLFAKSNPPLLEWLRSPIVYAEATPFAQSLRTLTAEYFSPRACLYHYLHMAQGNYREYLCGDQVRLKKYFYVLRPVLACLWIEAHGTMPPMEFDRLVEDRLPVDIKPDVLQLLARKRAGVEIDKGPKLPVINRFLESEMARLGSHVSSVAAASAPNFEALDALFRSTLNQSW